MKSIAVRIECSGGERERIREALRLCSGLAIGGITVTVAVSDGALGVVVDASKASAGGDDIAAQIAGFREVSLKIHCDRDEAREAGVVLPAGDLFVAVDSTTFARIDSGAEGMIVFALRIAPAL